MYYPTLILEQREDAAQLLMQLSGWGESRQALDPNTNYPQGQILTIFTYRVLAGSLCRNHHQHLKTNYLIRDRVLI